MSAGLPCSVEGCRRPVVAHGLCRSHYDRMRRVGSPIGPAGAFVDYACPTCNGSGFKPGVPPWEEADDAEAE